LNVNALLPIALLCLAGCVILRQPPDPNHCRVRLLGRWDASGAPDRLVTVNPGSSVEFAYEGTSCVLHVDRELNRVPLPQLWVRFDGTWTKHEVDRDEIVLGEGASRGEHAVWVVVKALSEHQSRWKKPLVGSLTVTGISLTQGEGVGFVSPPSKRKLILEAIGDSITEGVLVHRKGSPTEWTEIADARLTYAFRTAEALGAEPRIIGFGRQGLTREGNGGVPPVGLAYPFLYDGVPADDPPADIVLINHGGNDSGAPSIHTGYRKLIERVRARNPEAAIFCVVSFPQTHAKSVADAVVDVRAAGDMRVYFVQTKGWMDRDKDTTDGVHPNVQGHEKAAKKLVEFIRTTLAYKP